MFFILAGDADNHKISNAFEIRTANGNNAVITIAPSFLIGSSFLQVTRTIIKAWMSLNFGRISPRTAVLAALERPKLFQSTYNGRNVVSTLAHSFLILFIIAGKDDNHQSLAKLEFHH